ncbi:MAG: hypothetical protein CL561_00240 [Alphaproteobacteria bacterium]|nr:hypothetical protein [Alphaproteobacteria bacterium]
MKEFLTFIAIAITCLSFIIPMAVDAMAFEAEWRLKKNCKYYGAEMNLHATTQGLTKPCKTKE